MFPSKVEARKCDHAILNRNFFVKLHEDLQQVPTQIKAVMGSPASTLAEMLLKQVPNHKVPYFDGASFHLGKTGYQMLHVQVRFLSFAAFQPLSLHQQLFSPVCRLSIMLGFYYKKA